MSHAKGMLLECSHCFITLFWDDEHGHLSSSIITTLLCNKFWINTYSI